MNNSFKPQHKTHPHHVAIACKFTSSGGMFSSSEVEEARQKRRKIAQDV